MDVVAVYFTPDFTADGQFFGHLGFRPDSHGNEFWQALKAGDAQGVIGLHHIDGDIPHGGVSPDSPIGRPTLVHLGFETSEGLETVQTKSPRLRRRR